MDFNEVVAGNVRRIRQDQGLSVAELAAMTGSKKSLVYDWERPRKGAPQRAFLWSEIVLLCAALDVTVYELVLPSDSGSTTVADHMNTVHLPAWLESAPVDFRERFRPGDRSWLTEVLFGMDFKPGDVNTLARVKKRQTEKLLEELRKLLEETDDTPGEG